MTRIHTTRREKAMRKQLVATTVALGRAGGGSATRRSGERRPGRERASQRGRDARPRRRRRDLRVLRRGPDLAHGVPHQLQLPGRRRLRAVDRRPRGHHVRTGPSLASRGVGVPDRRGGVHPSGCQPQERHQPVRDRRARQSRSRDHAGPAPDAPAARVHQEGADAHRRRLRRQLPAVRGGHDLEDRLRHDHASQ